MNLKKLFSLLLAAMLCTFGLVASVSAEEVYPIVIKNAPSGHSYEAYQIFVGTLFEEYDESDNYVHTILANIEFGSGISEEGKAALLAKYGSDADVDDVVEALTDTAAAEAFAREIAPYLSAPDATSNVCDTANNNSYTLSITRPGYYLVRDAQGSTDAQDTTATAYLLKITRLNEATVLNLKQYTSPTPNKQVDDAKDAPAPLSDYDWSSVEDADIGKDVTFRLDADFPGNHTEEGTVYNFTGYDSYKIVFHDNLSKGLTFREDSVRAFANEDESKLYTAGVDYVVSVVENEDGTTKIEVTFPDVTALEYNGSDEAPLACLHVTYDATLNADAVIGTEGNPNRLYLEYSNNPGDVTATGLSEEIRVDVFTYSLRILKVDGNAAPLGGAKFVVFQKNGNENEFLRVKEDSNVFVTDSTKATVFTSDAESGAILIEGLEAGTYFVREVQAPYGFNKIDSDFEVTVSAEGDGIATVTVVNDRGFLLPETGSTGTAVLYTIGATLLLATGILFFSKKRAYQE